MKTLTYISSEIKKIVNNEASFLGIDGGNIKSKIWFCGVEFGATLYEMEDYYNSEVVDSYNVQELDIPYRIDCPEKFMKSSFDRRLALIYHFLTYNSEHPEKSQIDTILKREIYNKDSNIFKLNLFPLAKTDLSWNKDFGNILDMSKQDYYGPLFEKRISFIKDLVKRFTPTTIICFSPKEYSEYFVDAFFDDTLNMTYIKDFIILKNGRKAKIKILTDLNIKVVIIPFLGRGNLSSYDDVRQMTNHLKNYYL
jgi:hypothetical protein